MKEAQLQRKTQAELKRRGFWVTKLAGGVYQRAGLPDLLVVREGRAIFIEMKLPGGKPTELQASTLRELRRHGATTGVAHSVAEAVQIAEQQDT